MPTKIAVTTIAVLALGLGLLAHAPARAQHGGTAGGHGHGTHADADTHHPVEACEAAFDKVVADGRGFGMAFAADRNRYPGPLHVLELRARLGLTADQATRAQALLDAMFAESRPKGARLLQAERALAQLFADRRADSASVRAAVATVEQARAELRTVHLLTHLQTRALLTDEQLRIYHEARWPK